MEQITERLHAQYKKLRLAIGCIFVPLGLAVVFAFFNRYICLALILVALVYHLCYLRPLQKKYTSEAVRQNLLATVCAALDTTKLDEKGGGRLTEADLRAATLMPIDQGKNMVLLCQGVGGIKDGIQVDVCDATLAQHFSLVEKGKHRVHFNSGCWMRFRLPTDTGADWSLMHKDAIPTPIRLAFYARHTRYEQAALPEYLAENHLCYTPVDAPDLPAGEVLRQVKQLADYTPGRLAISLKGDTLTVYLGQRFLARPVSVSTPPTAETLGFDPMPELAYALRMAKVVAQHTPPAAEAEAAAQ